MVFVIEGTITCGLGLLSFFTLTGRPKTARWLMTEEKDLAIARNKLLKGILNPVTLATATNFGLRNITEQGLAFFAATIVKSIYPQHSVVSQQLHTTGRYLIYYIIALLITLCGFVMFLGTRNTDARYGATFPEASSAFLFGTLSNALISVNVISDTSRSAATGTNVLFGNIGGLVLTWSYLPFEGPNYPIGSGLNLAAISCYFVLPVTLLLWMKYDNQKRAERNMDSEVSGLSIKELQDLDWQQPGFLWKP
ncbi:uncharacterized protein Z519_11394 [Cladophialophora bantiana CBS 173.52]|uniref:Major facilitator superfamily (MFS) profile domain-containing protein n=1 Tax=Cladophialophora bantiana (strain ATCC 10958 / CBS 173.52 / CDC B-1940 / NIH 8579) TaxID=1442370 RepID=A0A0D2HA72_CLAB1|nr:uncharacterized protein Z519_11394 [Cladophialophora bantiana CBS 173.52]KIW87810.1 hypothetical protein Z519_11394 [Cladophialophora bantiana CBS 173.52]